MIDWNDAFAVSAYIPDAQDFYENWVQAANQYRKANATAELDIPYGPTARQKYDLFHPAGSHQGTVVFVHGGYWSELDKTNWSHFAAGPGAHGWSVAIPSYDLAPSARISEITQQIGSAITAISKRLNGPLRLVGHSAGGHLVSRMICANGPLDLPVLERIEHVLSISGLHDLRPLVQTDMNDQLGLTDDEAASESASLCAPVGNARVTAWVGGQERPEFIRQSESLEAAWPRAVCIRDANHHHFSVIDGLADPDSEIIAHLLTDDMGV